MRIISFLGISLLALLVLVAPKPIVADTTTHIPVQDFTKAFGNEVVAEAPCTVPYVFVNGTVAQAGQVNANFNALTQCLSSIYASDIVPTSLGQATFGGTLTYQFPSGVSVGGGPSGNFTNASGPLWVSQNGANTAPYALNFSFNNCGTSGAFAFWNANGAAVLDSIDCNHGNITNQYGSILGQGVTASNGNFVAPTGTSATLCPNNACGATSGALNVQTNGNVIAAGQVYGEAPTTNTTPAPLGPCFAFSGNPCNTGWHTVQTGSGGIAATISGTCATASWCSFTGSSNVMNFPSAIAFSTSSSYACTADDNVTASIVSVTNANGLQAAIGIYNVTGSPMSGTLNIGVVCQGI